MPEQGDRQTNGDLSVRGEDSRFVPGNPGGPGRIKGSRNRLSAVLERVTESQIEDVVDGMIHHARQGDAAVIKLLFSRLCPEPKGRLVEIDMPPVESAADVPRALGAILRAAAEGVLSPSEAATLAAVLGSCRRAIET